jgi:hypothetical protein
MMSLGLFLMVLALVLLVLATAKIPELPRLSWGWGGLLLWMVVQVLGLK